MSGTSRTLLLATAIAVIIGNLPVNIQPVLLGAAADGLGLSNRKAGLLLSIELLAFSGASFFVAGRITRFASAAVLMATGALLGAAHLSAALSNTYPLLAVTRCVAGACCGALVATAYGLIAQTRDPDRDYAYCLAALMGASMLAVVVMPMLTVPYAHHGAYGLLAAFTVLLSPVLLLVSPKEAVPAIPPPTGPIERPGLLLLGSTLLIAFGDNVIFSFSERIGLNIGLSAQVVGTGLAASYLGGIAGSLVAAKIGIRYGRRLPLVAGITLNAACGFAIAQGSLPALFFAALGAKNFSLFFLLSYLLGTAAALDPRGRVAGAVTAMFLMGAGVAPSAAGAVVALTGYPTLGWLAIAAATAALALLWPVLRLLGRSSGFDSPVACRDDTG